MKRTSTRLLLLTLGLAVIAGGLFAGDASAQTRRKKSTTTAKKKLPIPAPTLPIGNAEIISQASDQPSDAIMMPVETDDKRLATPDDANNEKIKDLRSRVRKLETAKVNEYDERQRRLALNLDILTKAEGRSDAIRKQLFEMIEKESTVRARLDQLDFDMRPEMITRASSTFSGSMKPEELREMREKSLKAEQQNLQALFTEIENTKARLDEALLRSDSLVEKLRAKLEKDIDDSLNEDTEDQ